MKKLLSLAIGLSLLLSLALPAYAAPSDSKTVEQTVKALGIMVGDEKGDMALYRPVTRAEFTKMLIAASVYKDTVQTGSGSSPFRDVKYTHWAADYIKTAVDNKWVTGYVDGSFRPDNSINFEEAASCILKLLGYGVEDLSGTYPSAQISKFRSLKLDSGLTLGQGQTLTRNDCMYIFFNLMGATTKAGKVYGETLGYTMNSAGEVDYSILILQDLEGPYVVNGGGLASILPFSGENATIYRNSKLSTAHAVSQHDVVYYHLQARTVWAYSDRIIGTYTAAAPNLIAPESVTVAGGSYSISTSAARHKLSSVGEFAIGDSVALLLGMNGDVVDVISSKTVDGAYYGVVAAASLSTYATDASTSKAEYIITVACTDGVTRNCTVDGDKYKAGDVVSVTYSGGIATVKRQSSSTSSLSGTVNSTGTKLGSYAFAEGVEILDVSKYGDSITLFPSRLSGAKLASDHIYLCILNSQKEITHLILKDVTGDMYSYGIVTSAENTEAGGSYAYTIGGVAGGFASTKTYNINKGPALFYISDGQIASMKNLTGVSLNTLSTTKASSASKTFDLAEDVQVYLRSKNGVYTLTERSAVNDATYTLNGYYEDALFPAGGQIRVIVASEK